MSTLQYMSTCILYNEYIISQRCHPLVSPADGETGYHASCKTGGLGTDPAYIPQRDLKHSIWIVG
jgi:hypothetical protein